MEQPVVEQPVVEQPVVTIATVADRAGVIETFVAAFEDDPAVRYFFPDDAAYHDQAAAYAGYLFDRRVAAGMIWTIDGGASFAMWESAPDPAPAPAPLPAEVLGRLATYDEAVHAAFAEPAHWYLGVLATHPTYAGKRWGRAVMAAGLRAAAGAGLPAYLETSNPRNVEIYRRAGWRVVERLTLRALPIWVMGMPSPSNSP